MSIAIGPNLASKAFWRPDEVVTGTMEGCAFKSKVLITNYREKIQNHYRNSHDSDLQAVCQKSEIPFAFGFDIFGILFEFEKTAELGLHNTDMVMDSNLKGVIEKYGVVIFRNAVLKNEIRNMCHDNNFAHLNFHRDRNEHHENMYSLYTRDPQNPDHFEPRAASTIFVDNAVAYLQARREKMLDPNEKGRRGSYQIFQREEVRSYFGDLILEQPWEAPAGMGEICTINNRTVLHSSFKKRGATGWRIGARYLF